MREQHSQAGFTLIEMMVTVGIMAMIAGVVIVAINPARQIAQSHNAQRFSGIGLIQDAVDHYAIENNGSYPTGIDGTLRMLGTSASGCSVICGPGTLASVLSNFIDNTLILFSAGNFMSTQWNPSVSAVDLSPAGLTAKTGSYTSNIKDAKTNVSWTTLAWTPTAPYNKELPNAQATETTYPAGNASMTSNRLLLHLNESSGALADSSGNNNNGAVSGSVTYGATGKFKTALSWSGGTNRYVFVNNNPTLNLANTGGSVAVWMQPTLALAANTGMGVIRKPDYGANLNTPGGYGMEIYRATAGGAHNIKMHLGWNNGTTNSQQIMVGAIPLTSGNWYQAVITWNATTMSIYVNGVLDVSATRTLGPLNWASNSATLDIGRNSDSVSTNRAWYSGIIDEVAVFNRTLTPTEVLDFYKRGAFKLRHQVRSCNDSGCNGETFVGPSGTAADYYDDANNTGLTTPSFSLTNLAANRYFQYKSYFDTDTTLYGPELRSVTINNDGSGNISTETTEQTAAACLDLTPQLVSTFIPAIPFDPASGTVSKTYYAIKKTGSDNLVVRACSPELNQAVEVRQ